MTKIKSIIINIFVKSHFSNKKSTTFKFLFIRNFLLIFFFFKFDRNEFFFHQIIIHTKFEIISSLNFVVCYENSFF